MKASYIISIRKKNLKKKEKKLRKKSIPTITIEKRKTIKLDLEPNIFGKRQLKQLEHIKIKQKNIEMEQRGKKRRPIKYWRDVEEVMRKTIPEKY